MKEKRSFALLFFIFMRMVFPIAELLPVWEYIFAVYDKASLGSASYAKTVRDV